jgi:hypothetical protein
MTTTDRRGFIGCLISTPLIEILPAIPKDQKTPRIYPLSVWIPRSEFSIDRIKYTQDFISFTFPDIKKVNRFCHILWFYMETSHLSKSVKITRKSSEKYQIDFYCENNLPCLGFPICPTGDDNSWFRT